MIEAIGSVEGVELLYLMTILCARGAALASIRNCEADDNFIVGCILLVL